MVSATKYTTAANAILLQYAAPIYVAVLSGLLLREHPRKSDLVFLMIAVGALILFFLDDLSAGHLKGNILAVLGGVTFALLILSLRMQKDAAPQGSVFLGCCLTVFITGPFLLDQVPSDTTSWLAMLGLGVFQTGMAYLCYAYAIRRVTALQGSLVPILEPILNPLWVFLFIGEMPGEWAVTGGAVIIVTLMVYGVISVRE
jgi:drug/metabolite transporter (DMT)-like permease